MRPCAKCVARRAQPYISECDLCHRERLRLSEERRIHGKRAIAKVRNEILRGRLAKLDGSVACVDCSKPARIYDHRDYGRPLDVEPVCCSCNQKRGPAAWPRTADVLNEQKG